MTQLTNLTYSAGYGDLLTTTNNGNGLTAVLANVQDGLGNNSPMQIATISVNFNRGGNTFELDGTPITAAAADINAVCVPNPVFGGTSAAQLPSGTTGQRPGVPVAGDMRFNTTTVHMEYYNGTVWVSF
jgi:hypothetical protein